MNYKRLIFQTVGAILLTLILIGCFVGIVDPYQQYRASDKFIGNQRLEIGGVARNHDYDAFITGSSMAMNHYPSLADSLWGWKTKNFSIMGATDDDYSVILPFIISRGKAQNIILALDYFSFARRRGAVNRYLYDDNVWNDYEYLWNYTSLKFTFQKLRAPLGAENLYHFSSPVGRHELLRDYQSKLEAGGYEGENFDIEQMTTRFDESLYSVIKNSADDVTWYVYFPPYSILEFIIYDKFGNLDTNLELKRHITERLSTLHNVRLYDFQQSPWITDLDEYMDLRHHSHEYNKAILQSIHNNEFRVIPDSLAGNEARLRNFVKQFTDSVAVL